MNTEIKKETSTVDVRSHGVWLDVWNFIWVGGVQGWRTGLKIRGRPFDSDPTHQGQLAIEGS